MLIDIRPRAKMRKSVFSLLTYPDIAVGDANEALLLLMRNDVLVLSTLSPLRRMRDLSTCFSSVC